MKRFFSRRSPRKIQRHHLRCNETLEPRIVLDSTVVINEIMFNPLGNDDGLEWIELYNQLVVDMDVSEWVLDGGINFTFPDQTVVPGRGHLVIAADPEAVGQIDGFPTALGPWEGRLSNSGEEIRLYNNDNRLMNSVNYGEGGGDWPVAPDGGGASLSKADQLSGSHISENWTFSQRIGGTPGVDNFIKPGTFVFENVLPEEAPATVHVPADGSLGDTWIVDGFDDSAWISGTTGIGHDSRTTYEPFMGIDLDEPPNEQTPSPMLNVNTSAYIRVPFTVSEGASYDTLRLRMRYDDGFVAYLNGTRVAASNAPDTLSWNALATSTNSDRNAVQWEDFDLTANAGLLKAGENLLAIHALGRSLTDNDGLWYPTIVGGTEIKPLDQINLEITEVGAAGVADFFVEIANTGDEAIDLSGLKIVAQSDAASEYAFPGQTLAVGERISINAATLGFNPANGDLIGIYNTEGTALADVRRVDETLRGQSDEHDGRWLYPNVATPGAANSFDIPNDIVINEIMYHPPPTLSVPDKNPTYTNEQLISFDSTWKYNATGADLGLGWASQSFAVDDTNWKSGQAAIGYETSTLAVPIRTELPRPTDNNPRFLTYYMQQEFELTQETLDSADIFQLRHMIDDGSIFYINGVEVDRFNLPAGDITADIDADRTTSNAEILGPFNIGTDLFKVGMNTISAEVHLTSTTTADIFFAAELNVGEQITDFIPGSPYAESGEEWIELYNQGSQEVDLTGWKLRDAIGFDFEDGTKLAAGEYLVIAKDANLMTASYPGIRVAGSFSGSLGDRDDNIRLYDANQNLADEVHYYEGGRWDSNADGGGSSLQLRNPKADNSKGENWSASYEGDKSEWTIHSFRGISQRDTTQRAAVYNEFIFGLLDSGEFLIDDVEVIEKPGTADARQMLQNGTFEADAIGAEPDKWRVIGNHFGTVIADPTDPNNQVLHVLTTGAQQHVHDHAETTFTDNVDIVDGTEYELRFRAKWLAGNRQLNSRLYFSRLSNTVHLHAPVQMGTPGAQNSNFVENTGPAYENLKHFPATPIENQEVTVSVDVADVDGLGETTLFYRKDDDWSTVTMTRAIGDRFEGTIPGHGEGDIVQFYVESTDSKGEKSMFPAAGPDSRALFQVEDGRTPRSDIERYRVILREDEERLLFLNTNRMSNQNRLGTLIQADTVFHNVKFRQVGSRWIRPNSGYKVTLNSEQAFYDVHDSIRLDLNGLAEVVMKGMVNRAGIGQNSMYDDIGFLVSPNNSHSHEILVNLARYENLYLDEQFGSSSGTKWELDDVTFPNAPIGGVEGLKSNTEVNQTADIGVSGAVVARQGDNPEFYRSHLLIKNNRAKDDFASIARLAQAIHQTDDMLLFEATNEVMDVDSWMRHYANQAYFGNWDTYGFGRPKNLRIITRPDDGKFIPLFWDCDLCNFTEPLFNRSEATSRLDEIRAIPHNLRLFWGHMWQFIETSYNEEYVQRWASHYGEKAANQIHGGDENFAGIVTSTRTRSAQARNAIIDAIPQVDFAITTNDGNPMNTDADVIRLEGKGWVDVREVRLNGVDQPLELFWPETDIWQVDLPLAQGENTLTLDAYGFDGSLIASDSISVTSSIGNPVIDSLRISEINYNPGDATEAELALGFGNDDFEFIEFVNIGSETISLASAELGRVAVNGNEEGVVFKFAEGAVTELQAGQRLVVVENAPAFAARYGDNILVAGEYAGSLSNSSETLTILANGLALQQFEYRDGWYSSTDGNGSTLEIFQESGALEKWSVAEGWRASIVQGGTPGSEKIIPGDANRDGIFDSGDLVLISQAGEYEDGVDGNSDFAEGDFNGDGDFTSRDIVLAFIYGAYDFGPAAVPVQESSDRDHRFRPLDRADRVDAAFGELEHDNDEVAGLAFVS